MPPPGVNTIFDHLDIMTFPCTYGPVSSTLKSPFAVSSLSPARSSISESFSALSSIHSDHDYHIKSHICCEDYTYRMVTKSHCNYCDVIDCDNSGDAMLSSYAVDSEKIIGDGTDTDFLKDLDDLSFNFNDPCCEVAMEDSFQEFIDSALEQSYPPFFGELSDDKPVQDDNAVILNKAQFLASLSLRPLHEHHSEWSTSSPTCLPRQPSFNSMEATDKTYVDQQSSNQNTQIGYSHDVIPTRQCSCVESVFKAVYSTAHPRLQECVRTCPSTLNTGKNSNCTEFLQNKISQVIMSPLFIDTSSNRLSNTSLQSSSEGCLDIMTEDDAPWRIDNETADIMKWLSESQQDTYQHNNDSNNNIVCRVCVNEDTIYAETSSEKNVVAPSFDLESFVDLDEFDTEITDRNDELAVDDTCQRTIDQSKISKSVPCISKLKLSLLTEHLHSSSKYRHSSFSDVYSESSHTEKLSPKSSDLSYCGLSPAWSRTDSIQSAISPVPLTSMDISWSSNFDDTTDDTSVKSPFALLNLFSDENAVSLLHTDSTVPNIRFM